MSRGPDFGKDPVVEVAVLWETVLPGSNSIEIASWHTTNALHVGAIERTLVGSTWRSLSILADSHPTRVILRTRGGVEWEVHMFGLGTASELAMFNRGDIGTSGVIGGFRAFTEQVEALIAADKGCPVDIRADYRHQREWAGVPRVVPDATRTLSDRFPWHDGTKGHL